VEVREKVKLVFGTHTQRKPCIYEASNHCACHHGSGLYVGLKKHEQKHRTSTKELSMHVPTRTCVTSMRSQFL
jgi:hypothetical protein